VHGIIKRNCAPEGAAYRGIYNLPGSCARHHYQWIEIITDPFNQNGDFKFPGGEIIDNEIHRVALAREIREECDAQVTQIGPAFGKVIGYDIPRETFILEQIREHYFTTNPEYQAGLNMLSNLDESTGMFLKAIHFSAGKHRDQRRKDEVHSPYINHPIDVARRLWEIGGVRDSTTLVSAMLHDTLEDTQTNPDEIRMLFGEAVLAVVLEVSDDKSLPKQTRKRLQIEHAPHISDRAKLVKLADKSANLFDLIYSPPRAWSFERRQRYLLWTEQVVAGLCGTNLALEKNYDEILANGKQILKLT